MLASFIYWYSDAVKYDFDGIRLENKKRYYQMLNENLLAKGLPEVLCLSDEFLERGVKSIEESKELKKLEI